MSSGQIAGGAAHSPDKSLGQVVGGIVGAVVGTYTGVGPVVGYSIGSAIGGLVDPPKGPSITGPRLQDLTVQTSSFGTPLPRLYGTVALHGNVIWLENNQIKETVRKKKQGGKGGSSATVKTYTYSATFAVSLCDAPSSGIAGVRRVWIGSDLVYNAGSDNLETIIASNQAADGLFRVYPGSDDQMPDPRIEAEMGVGNAPAFRGTAYIMLYDLPLEKYGNSIMGAQVKVEVTSSSSPAAPSVIYHGPQSGTNILRDAPIFPENLASGVIAYYMVRSDDDQYFNIYEHLTRGAPRFRRRVAVGEYFRPPRRYVGPGMCVSGDNTLERVRVDSAVFGGFPAGATPNWSAECDGYRCYLLRNISGSIRLDMVDGLSSFSNTAQALYSITLGVDYLYGLGDAGMLYVLSRDDLSGVYSVHLDGVNYVGSTNDKCYISYADGLIWLGPVLGEGALGEDSFRVRAFDPASGALVHDFTNVPGVTYSDSMGYRSYVRDGLLVRSVFGDNPAVEALRLAGIDVSGVPLADVVVGEVMRSSLIGASDLDLGDLLSDMVHGYRPVGVQQVRACLAPLQAAYPFDLIMSGYQIKAVRRGKSSVVTIPIELLDARTYGDEMGPQLEQSREMDSQLPRQLVLRHLDADREYDINEQRSAERMSTQAVDVREVELPLVLTPDEGARAVDVLFNVAWLERAPATFRLPPIYLGLEPADVIMIDAPYGQFELRLMEVNYLPDGRLECSARPNSAANYTSSAVGGEGEIPDGTIGLSGRADTVLLDIPLIRNQDDEPGFAAAMAGVTDGWAGGVLFRSVDSGQTWTDVQAWAAPATMGYGRDPLGAHDGYVIDRTSTLRIDLTAGELEAISESQMMTGMNWVAYGADGRWELMRFADCVLQADGSYIISTLLRGLRGSEWATGLHQFGDVFVLLDDPDVMAIGADISSVNVVRQWRGVSVGQSIDSAENIDFAYRGVNLRPLSVVKPAATRPSNNWAITWDRRTRLQGTLWKTGQELPLGEASERYEIDILSGSAIVRTLTATGQTVTYTQAQQVEDFGSVQSSITVVIYMISATVGRGFPTQVTFSL